VVTRESQKVFADDTPIVSEKIEKLPEKDIDEESARKQRPVEGITKKGNKKIATVFWGNAKEI
jgi:hypothetical protein